ncbi:MAG TPA: ABC transporter permease [Rhodanobacteraceae bacterium]
MATTVAASLPTGMTKRRVLGAYLAEARSECLRYLRSPGFLIPVMIFSCMFYLLFAVVMGGSFGHGASTYLLASYSVFGIMSPGLFGFGASLAIERDNGLLTLKRALPVPPGAYLIGKMIMAMVVAAGVVVLLLLMAEFLGHVPVTPGMAAGLFATDVLGVLPFCAMGMWVGTLIKGQGAPGLLNLVYLPMSFLSGLWIPLPQLPHALQKLAPIFPSYHLEAIALDVVGMAQVTIWPHVLVLIGFAVVFLGLAMRRLRRHG